MTKGLVRIRLARFGRTNSPKYNIVVANAHKARDTKPIEVLGTYNPIPRLLTKSERKKNVVPHKDIELDFSRAKYWIGVGAQPSETVTKLMKKCGILGLEWGKTFASRREAVQPQKEALE
ncbi:LAMI_0F12706g1_1 [Lachancea mirantina]|uniref:LAMI_0F12706g1_1 n=1 Tax=Lachancea mirantina TaxID=1230905 RepID=A0A1G4K328_9SACH|nr:LAMI_0F12706g1_1 [Lachancea mirantina]